MCTHALSESQNDDRLLGMEEYKSPFGTYELKVLVDETISCTDESTVMDRNRRKGEGDWETEKKWLKIKLRPLLYYWRKINYSLPNPHT